jgi:hypothetical protein
MFRLRCLLVLAISSVLVTACGQEPSLVISFDGRNCIMQANKTGTTELSIELRNNSGQGAWFGIGMMSQSMTLDRMASLVDEADSPNEAVIMGLFDPAVPSIGEYLPVDGALLIWGTPLDPGRYSVWCTTPDGNFPNPAATAGIFER